MNKIGQLTKSMITDVPCNTQSAVYKEYDKKIPFFMGQAVYVYSFKEHKMLYAKGWNDLLGYKDDEISMLTIVSITSEKYAAFSNELNDKSLQFLATKTTDLEKYSFTLEVEKIHKNGKIIPLFSRVGVYKANNGKMEEIIGISQLVKTLKFGNIMQYAAYGPEASNFEETLNKELFKHQAISRKEKEALQLAAKGFPFKQIAHQLGVSQSAIEKRVLPLYKRFRVNSLPHLIDFAHSNHIF